MKTLKYILPIVVLLMFGCGDDTVTNTELDRSNNNFGTPNKITVASVPYDETHIAFGIITDTHCDASYAGWVPGHDHDYRDTPRMLNNRSTVINLWVDATMTGCLGIVHLGDAVDDNNTQNLIAFRQLWENDYPGRDGGSIAGAFDNNYNAYSQGYRINKPVFPTLGNHDIPTYSDGETEWNQVATYLRARIDGAPGIVSYHGCGAYAWRWGQYFCIQLGTWAGSGRNEGSFSQDKLDWLENVLAEHVGNSYMGVLIFQHYGWDSFSTENRWWTAADREIFLNILCQRDNANDPANIYNVLGIFTGHVHAQGHYSIPLGQDPNGFPVWFDNYTMMSAGTLDYNQYGFSIVTITGDELKISNLNLHNNVSSTYSKPIQIGN